VATTRTSQSAHSDLARGSSVKRDVVRRWVRSPELIGYASAVVVGAVLMVIAAENQPYNQNELEQIRPYGGNDIDKIIHATRQPPLDPLLGALVQHIVGVGQLRQRLVPVAAGIIALILMSLILRQLRCGIGGVFAMWAMATAPLLVRYSAYTRPYALPLMLMLAYVFAAIRFEESRSKRWLVLLVIAAAAMPATRVPEPNLFLGVVLVITLWRVWRLRMARELAIPLVAVPLLAIALIGYPLYRVLAGQAENIWDPSPSGVVDRFPAGVHEVVHGFLPLLSEYLPWWPLLLTGLVAVVAIPHSRRRIAEWWFFWPLLAAPVIFGLAYHFMNPYSFEVRPYRMRMAIFFVPAFVLIVAALADAAIDTKARWTGRARVGLGVLVLALIVTQLPSTAKVLTQNEAPDFQQAANVLKHDIPRNSIVLYDTISPVGRWRQPFSGKPRYIQDRPFVHDVRSMMKHPRDLPVRGPVYVLILDSECSYSVVCDLKPAPWDQTVPGWHVAKRFDRFTLYAPDAPLSGRAGVALTMEAFGRDLTPKYGFVETYTAAAVLKIMGDADRARKVIEKMYATAGDARGKIEKSGMDPFG
jgi:hypothetical protein